MSARFVIGRAGSGKTHHCLEAIRSQLRSSPWEGPQLVLLVPEQASLQMERALLRDDLRAIARAQVLSFHRLAFYILRASGATERSALSASARAMVLRTIVGRLSPRLRYYRRVDRLGGFLDRLGHTISELIEEAVAPADLRLAEDVAGSDAGRLAKLADLADIYEAYLAYLGEKRLDASQYLQLAREVLPGGDFLRGALLWVDGFAGFTRQELLLLADLGQRAGAVELTLLLDPARLPAVRQPSDIDPAELFARPLRTYLALRDQFHKRGLAIGPPLALTPKTPPRYQGSRELARMEAALVDGQAPSDPEPPSSDVHLVTATDRRSEVEYAVARVCRWVQESKGALRYRDVALIVRDLEPYHDLLSAALAERNIPFFIDRRRSIAHHPLVEFVRGAVAVATESFSLEAVRLLLKTALLGLAEEEADELENYILAHGITGLTLWTGSDWEFLKQGRARSAPALRQREHLGKVNAARRRIVEILVGFVDLARQPQTGAVWADGLRRLLERISAAEALERWARRREADGDVELAAEHRQTWSEVSGFIDDLGEALGEAQLDVTELGPVIEGGLAQLTLGLVPPTIDQVLVSSIERSRHPEIKAAIILGFNDGVFPLLGSEDFILHDEDRELLSGHDVQIGLTRRQRVMDEALLAYVAVTRPSEKLVISCATADCQGKVLRISPFVQMVRHALPGVQECVLGDPRRGRTTWPIMTVRDLAGCLAAEMRRRPSLKRDDPIVRREWNDIYSVARAALGEDRSLRRALAALQYRNEALLSGQSVDKLIDGTYTASVSELETFAACPFQRFARYGLRLKERVEADLGAVDIGAVHHAILEGFLNGCLERREGFADVPAADVLPRLEESAGRIRAELEREGALSSARDAYILQRSARDLSFIINKQQRVCASGRFRPHAAEKKFGFAGDSDSLGALEIVTPLGRKVFLRGLIDRVDLAEVGDEIVGVVVDYKRTRDKRLDLAEVYHGLSLQLVGYLLVLAERGASLAGRPITPVGAFYVSLLRRYTSVAHPDDADEVEDAPGAAAPRGLFDSGRLDILDTDAPDAGRSRVFNIFRKKDGQLGHVDSGDAAEPQQFAALLECTRRKMGALADSVLDGDVSVSPYRLREFSPCGWCAMQAVCRFEFGDPGMRHLEGFKRSEVFEMLATGA